MTLSKAMRFALSLLLTLSPLAVTAQSNGEIRYQSNTLEFYRGGSWVSMNVGNTAVSCTGSPGEIRFNTTPNPDQLEFCDGTTWRRMNHQVTGDTCSTAGEIQWYSVESVIRYCNGANWVAAAAGWSGFPTVASTSSSSGNTTSQTVNLPSGIQNGNLLIVLITTGSSVTVTTPSGWTSLFNVTQSGGGHAIRFAGYYRIADGSEGASLGVTFSGSTPTAHHVLRITQSQGVPESATANGVSANPDPPSLTPSWGAANTLWLAVYGSESGDEPVSSYPTSYTNGFHIMAADEWVRLSSAQRERNAATENPSTFSMDGGTWVAATIAIRPGS